MLKIYIANLGKYNEGELVGKWVELPCEDLDEVLKEIEVVDGTQLTKNTPYTIMKAILKV